MAIQRTLPFDVVPAGLVGGRNFRQVYKYQWSVLRARRFAQGDLGCEVCGVVQASADKLDGHEVYSFPNGEVVRLDRVLFICKLCHDAAHLERTRGRASAGYVAALENHYRRVNGDLSEEQLAEDYAQARRASLALRNQYGGGQARPRIDYGPLQEMADKTEARRPERDDDDADFEMFPDHECPWDIGMAH